MVGLRASRVAGGGLLPLACAISAMPTAWPGCPLTVSKLRHVEQLAQHSRELFGARAAGAAEWLR